jgi:hypothetical protein
MVLILPFREFYHMNPFELELSWANPVRYGPRKTEITVVENAEFAKS